MWEVTAGGRHGEIPRLFWVYGWSSYPGERMWETRAQFLWISGFAMMCGGFCRRQAVVIYGAWGASINYIRGGVHLVSTLLFLFIYYTFLRPCESSGVFRPGGTTEEGEMCFGPPEARSTFRRVPSRSPDLRRRL